MKDLTGVQSVGIKSPECNQVVLLKKWLQTELKKQEKKSYHNRKKGEKNIRGVTTRYNLDYTIHDMMVDQML